MSNPSILLVDDEPITMRLAQRYLNRWHPTHVAQSVREAIQFLEAGDIEIGLVITDMKMPNENGLVLIEHLYEHYKHIAVIASTGDVAGYDFATFQSKGMIFGVLEKPWANDRVLETIDAALKDHYSNGGSG